MSSLGRGQLNWSVSTYFCTKHIYQNLVFVSCTHRDLYLINQSQAFMHRLSIKVAKSSCCTGHKERTERKSSLSGDQGGAVQLRLAATHISRSQCHNIAAATLVHRTLTFEPPAPSCFSEQIIRVPRCPPQLHLAGEAQLELNPALRTGQAGDNTES